MSERRALVTGAAGFVGGAIVRGLRLRGWDVFGLDRSFAARAEEDGVRRVVADLAAGVPDRVPAVDVVVHAAWVTTDPDAVGQSRAEYVTSNIRPLLSVLDFAARTHPESFVFLSSSGVFAADDAGGGLTDADRPTGTSAYAAAKRIGEGLVLSAFPSGSGDAVAAHVARLGYLYGPGEIARPSRDRVSAVAEWLDSAHEGEDLRVREDDPERDWTLLTELTPVLLSLLDDAPSPRPIHLGSPHVVRDSVLAAHVAEVVAEVKPGTRPVAVRRVAAPRHGPAKPPMVPSDLPAIRSYEWTPPLAGVRTLVARDTPPIRARSAGG